MGKFTQDTLSFYHTFSKTQVNNTAPYSSLGNSINKSGHTVQASDVWADDIPFFAEKGTTGEVHSIFSAHAQTNDLVKVGSKIYQRNATPYTSGATFETLWSEKTKSITDWSIVDGEYQYTEVDGALVDGSYLVNAAGKPVIKYYERAQLSILTAANNANVTSGKLASRLKVGGTWGTDSKESVPFMNGGRWVEQFVTVTDKYVNGEAATIYAPQVYLTSTAAAPQVAGTVYFDFCATGVILWDSRTANGQEVITCFEYVGDKLSNALTNISSEIEDIVATTMEGVVASVGTTNAATTAGLSIKGTKTAPTVDITTGTVASGEAKLVTGGAVASVTDALAGRISQLEGIQHFSVVVVPEGQKIEDVTPLVENTIYLVNEDNTAEGTYIEYIAYKPAGSETVVTEKIGSTALDLSGYTTDAEHTALADRVTALDAATTGRVAVVESEISTLKTTTIPAIQQSVTDAITTAKGYTDTTLSNALKDGGSIATAINAAKEAAIASAEVTINAGTGISIEGEGKGATFTISVDDTIATKTSVDELSVVVSGVSQTVASNKTDLEGQITTAQTTLQGNINGVSERVTTLETVTVPGIDTRLQSAEATITSLTTGNASVDSKVNAAKTELQGKIDEINTSLTTGAIHTEIDGVRQTANAAKTTADTAVQTVTGDTYVKATKTGTTVTLETQVSALDTALVAEGTSIANAIAAAKKAGTDAASALNTAKNQSLAQTGTLSGMFTVQTAGTVGTGITGITISDAGLSAAITKAKTDAETTAATNLATARGEITTEIGTAVSGLETKLTEGAGSLGAKVTALETATGTTLPAAIEQALEDAKAYSDSLHTTSLDYVVLGDSESLPTASADTLGKIYLVASQNAPSADGSAISGSYVEYMTRKVSETEYTWEKIGTTAADLNAYAKTADVTSSIATAKSEAIAAAKTETTTQVNALAATHATDKTALEGSISAINDTIAAMDATETVNGLTVTQVDGKITGLSETLITASVPAGTTSVGGNVAYVGSTKHVIAPEKFQTAAQMPSTLTSWVADLSNLTVGDNMFNGCTKLTVFIGDLSSLTSATGMFNGCNLDAESLEILAENLPTAASGATIDIGASTNASADVIATIKGKGWTVTSNGTAL